MTPLRQLRTAVGFLTVAPAGKAPQDFGTDPSWLAAAPLVGAALAAVSASLLAALRGLSADRYQQLLSAALVIGFLALVTRGLHLDGFADTVDGLGAAGRGPEAGLAAMRDPHTGAFAAAALSLLLITQVAALWQDVAVERGTTSVITAVTVSRCALLWGARRGVTSARDDGLGVTVVGSVPTAVVVLASAAVVAACSAVGALDDNRGAGGAAHVAVASVLGLAAAVGLRRRAERRLGGVTGDVLGGMVELAMTTVLVVMAYDIDS